MASPPTSADAPEEPAIRLLDRRRRADRRDPRVDAGPRRACDSRRGVAHRGAAHPGRPGRDQRAPPARGAAHPGRLAALRTGALPAAAHRRADERITPVHHPPAQDQRGGLRADAGGPGGPAAGHGGDRLAAGRCPGWDHPAAARRDDAGAGTAAAAHGDPGNPSHGPVWLGCWSTWRTIPTASCRRRSCGCGRSAPAGPTRHAWPSR